MKKDGFGGAVGTIRALVEESGASMAEMGEGVGGEGVQIGGGMDFEGG